MLKKCNKFIFNLTRVKTIAVLALLLNIYSAKAQSSIIESPTKTYDSYGTVGNEKYLGGVLNPGDEVEVGARTEIAAEVTATTGINAGRSAWTALSNLSATADEVSGDSTDPYLMQQTSDTIPYDLNQAVKKDPNRPEWLSQEGIQEEEIPNSDLFTPATDQEIWDGASGENPTYRLDGDNYDGGEYIPFYRETYDAFGTPTRTRHYVRADPTQMVRLQQETARIITGRQSTYCGSGIYQTTPPVAEGSWIPSCEVLQNTNLGSHNQQQLNQCVLNIRRAIQSNGSSRSSLFRNLYSKLNSREQEFAAMIFTTIGEGRSENHADRVMIMKVLNNRARYAQEHGSSGANELDAALQYKQFSMYNEGDPNWQAALLGRHSSQADITKSIQSYLLYRNTSFGDGSTANSIYHYHTPGVNPDWSDPNKRVHPAPNGETPSTHKFFSGVAWEFSQNNFRP
jgi:hypothetical protein